MSAVRKGPRREWVLTQFLKRTMQLSLTLLIALALWHGTETYLELPDFAKVAESHASDSLLLDRSGHILQERRIDFKRRQLQWMPLEQISSAARDLIIASEDRRFFEHPGVDVLASLRAAFDAFAHGAQGGASTISMQVVKHLHERGGRSYAAKFDQSLRALLLEWKWSKAEILEAYLNLISFRGELQGIHAASRMLFHKRPSSLDRDEALLLAAMIRSPNASTDKILARACRLLLVQEHPQVQENPHRSPNSENGCSNFAPTLAPKLAAALDPASSAKAKANASALRPANLAYHLASLILPKHPPGSHIRTSIDRNLQREVQRLMAERLGELSQRNVRDAAALVVSNATGEVLAYVGSSGPLSPAPLVDGIQAMRQAGSTLKPFIYARALDERQLTAASLLDDSPLELAVSTGAVYRPQNFDRRFRGVVSVRDALANSLNIPAIRALMLIGVEEALQTMQQIGFDELRPAEDYGPSLALGSADVSLWQLVRAYRVLANGGLYSDLSVLPAAGARSAGDVGGAGATASEKSPRRVVSEAASFIVSDILSDRRSRSRTFGAESFLHTPFFSAVKTGTSKDMRDNWCVGYGTEYTVGVWVGNFSGESTWNVSGVSGAGPLWNDIMNRLAARASLSASHAPQPPAGVVQRQIAIPVLSQRYLESFVAGTEPADDTIHLAIDVAAKPRILYPTQDLLIAIDPDIPQRLQKVPFLHDTKAQEPQTLAWRLNGNEMEMPSQDEGTYWTPKRGSYALELLKAGIVLDSIRFEVR